MHSQVEISFRLPCFVREESAGVWVSSCPQLEVASQGATEEQAKHALEEAVTLWIESCLTRETLPQAMRDVGMQSVPPGSVSEGEEHIRVTHTQGAAPGESAASVLGTEFPLHITVPAYQAAAFSATNC